MQLVNSSIPLSARSKFRGCLLGALVGDCMGSRFDRSSDAFAAIASRIEPSSLRNQIPRNGGRFLFPVGVDSVMMLATGQALLRHSPDSLRSQNISSAVLANLKGSLEHHTDTSSSIKWGAGTRNALENSLGSDSNLRSNCGITRALVSGLVMTESTSEAVCRATHTHPSAIEGAQLIERAIKLALAEDRLLSASDVPQHMSVYKRLVPRAIDLATKGEYTEDDDFTTDLQDRFKARFGADASSQCAFASMLFSTYRTAHALPYLDTSSREYRERIEEMAKAGLEKEKSGVAKNVMGNSNRLDSAMLFSKLTPSIEQDLPIALSIGWAISLGGDVRSNAYLAGGLSGALWGEEGIPDEWLMFCQGVDEARALADELFTRYSNQ